MSSDLRFEILRRTGSAALGHLKWSVKGLTSTCISGPYGKGPLPQGKYDVRRAKLVDMPSTQPSFCDKSPGPLCWFQAIEPTFSTARNGLGIHPDGGIQGTEGCIGILDVNSRPWYDSLASLSNETVLSLEVIDINRHDAVKAYANIHTSDVKERHTIFLPRTRGPIPYVVRTSSAWKQRVIIVWAGEPREYIGEGENEIGRGSIFTDISTKVEIIMHHRPEGKDDWVASSITERRSDSLAERIRVGSDDSGGDGDYNDSYVLFFNF